MARPELERVEALFHRLADLRLDEQTAILDAECVGDPELRAAVEELLHHDAQALTTDWLSSPIERSTYTLQFGQAAGDGSAPTSAALTVLPGYEILEEIGRGGMGVVFKARQTALGRFVALKILLPAAPATTEQVTRFRTEAEALARVQHPNIVQIYDVGEYQGRPYLAMEYVAGPNLARKLDGRPQPIQHSARLVEVLARAIQTVHDRGLLHRDLKPGNVLLATTDASERTFADHAKVAEPADSFGVTAYGVPKITDFGLAIERDAKSRLTRTGVAIGTPCYMAPEQASGKKAHLGPAADIYALGAILYEMLTGRPPFSGATAQQTIALVLLEDPLSPVRMRPDLPPDLATICLKCLEKEPRQRYARADDLADDLRRFQEGRPVVARSVGAFGKTWRWCRRRPLVAGLTALSTLLAISLVTTVLVYETRLNTHLTHELADTTHELADTDKALGTRSLQDGDNFLALLWFAEAVQRDRDRPEQEQTIRAWIATAMAHAPRLARFQWCEGEIACAEVGPAGSWAVRINEDGMVQVVDLTTSLPVGSALKPPRGAHPVGISHDGRLIALAVDSVLEIWDRDTKNAVAGPIREKTRIDHVSFSADNHLILTRAVDGGAQAWHLSSQRRTPLVDDQGRKPTFAAHGSDGRWLVTLHEGHRGVLRDGNTGKALSHALDVGGDTILAAPSRDGRHVVLATANRGVWLLDTHTNARRLLCYTPHTESALAGIQLSPDRSKLLCIAADHVSVWDIRSGARLAPRMGNQTALVAAGFNSSHEIITIGNGGVLEGWELPDRLRTVKAPEAQSNPSARPHSVQMAFGNNPAVDVDALPPTMLQALARVLSGKRLEAGGRLVNLTPAELRAAWDTLQTS